MAKADLLMTNGTRVSIEGTTDEVAELLRLMAASSATPGPNARRRTRAQKATRGRAATGTGPRELIRELRDSDFFKAKRGLGEVQKALEEAAHVYPITSLSPALFRMVRDKELRRIKEDGTWKYVNP